MTGQLNSHMFSQVYEWLGINLNNLGCVMLNLEVPSKLTMPSYTEIAYDLYYAKNKERFWIDGEVFTKKPHTTLLYGLLQKGPTIKNHIDKVLEGWECKELTIVDIDSFPSPYQDEEYYCINATIQKDPVLLEGHQRLEFLPHVNTFAEYRPHMTIAYIQRNHLQAENVLSYLRNTWIGEKIKVIGIDYGKS